MTWLRYCSRISCVMIFSSLSFGGAEPQKSVHCGDTLNDATIDYVLTSNLTCSTDPAVGIAADNIRFDLGGFTIKGTGKGTAILILSTSGTGTTLLNAHVHRGTIRGFAIGIDLAFVNNSHFERLEVSSTHVVPPTLPLSAAIRMGGSSNNNLVDRNELADNDVGILVLGPGNVLIKNKIQSSTLGIVVESPGSNFIFENTISSSIDSGGRGTAITLGSSRSNTVQNCILENNDIGISVSGPGAQANIIRGNTATGNNVYGIQMDLRGTSNTITENVALRNGVDDLFDFGQLVNGMGVGCVNTWLDNTFNTANKSCIH